MKKSLIALAVLGFTGAAMAQSSVTLYGVADAGIARTQTRDPVTGDKTSKTGMAASGTMNNGTSRLGVRGVEDLGGGLKVGFNFEHGLSLGNGAGNLSGGQMWSRAANLWIGGNWGTFKMGRTLNPTFYSVAAWELTGTANYSVVGKTYGYSGGARNSNQFSYKTPNMGGFSAELGYIMKDDNGGNAKWDLNAIYANGPIAVGLGVNKTKGDKTNYALGGKYNFGSFAVAASVNNANAAGLVRRGFSLGGSANMGAFTVTLDLTRDTKNDFGGEKYTNGVLEGKYALSKRTFVYAAYLRLDSTNNYGIGLRHNF
ncbi:MAG: porin [Proteobacteria bacterium]|nr:porin [Pseudomonadota bacterium]